MHGMHCFLGESLNWLLLPDLIVHFARFTTFWRLSISNSVQKALFPVWVTGLGHGTGSRDRVTGLGHGNGSRDWVTALGHGTGSRNWVKSATRRSQYF